VSEAFLVPAHVSRQVESMSHRKHFYGISALATVAIAIGHAAAQTTDLPAPRVVPVARDSTQPLTLEQALRWALENNPTLRTQRQAHNVAAAEMVIARTYPFNPALENRVQDASGPTSAGIGNVVPIEEVLVLELEVRGQGKYRREAASAALSRTDWTIADQEQTLAVQVVRAFDALLYQQEKMRLLERVVQLDQELVANVTRLFNANVLGASDRIVAETELDDARAALSLGRVNVITAQAALRTALGTVTETFTAEGTLEMPPAPLDLATLTEQALQRRPDLKARQSALLEAEASLRLTDANRYGNPAIGPVFTYDPSRASSIGAQINVPLPVLNNHRGDILKAQAVRAQAQLELQQTEITIRQEVEAAVAHLRAAEARATMYRTQVLPHLEQALQDVRKLFQANAKGVGLLQVVDVQRKLATAQAAYLDALFEQSQARAELFAAVGSLPVAVEVHPPSLEVLPGLTPKAPGWRNCP
jgi:cobalt-zinc-cadmium efflux system outer membrane protein